jgi:lipoprotein-releasing system ATP-binding protein
LDLFRSDEVGFVFQFHHLMAEFTALENVAIGGMIAGLARPVAEARARELLVSVGLEARLTHRPPKLSGGERQRVALARALVNEPRVVLADEPTGNLDRKTSEAVHDLIWDLRDRLRQTFVIVTHNPGLADRSDRTVELVDGRIAEGVSDVV